jgi:hypothetical protein
MNTYFKVTHTEYGQSFVKWFSTKEDAKRYAMPIVKRGYAPQVFECDENFNTTREVLVLATRWASFNNSKQLYAY